MPMIERWDTPHVVQVLVVYWLDSESSNVEGSFSETTTTANPPPTTTLANIAASPPPIMTLTPSIPPALEGHLPHLMED